MPDIWYDVDAALAEVPVNVFPLSDDTDFKSIEGAVAYNAAGMALRWHFATTAGAYTVTSVTPTTAGVHDWTDQGDSGIYTIEIPASAGTINNDTEGVGWFTGVATGVLPWRGPTCGFRAAAINNALIDEDTLTSDLAALESELIVVHSDTLAIEAKASDTHSRLVVVESSIDSDQTSRITSISDVKSALVVTDAVVDTIYSDTALIVPKTSDTHSRLVVVESAIDSDQTSRTTAISDVKSELVVVSAAVAVVDAAVVMATGTSDSGTTTTMVDAARTEGDTDYWVGNRILFTSGTIAGQVREITGFNFTTNTVTFSPATTQAVATQTYKILQGVAASGMSAAQDSKLTRVQSDAILIYSDTTAIEAGGGSLTAAQDSKLTRVQSDAILIEAKASDTHSRLVVVESAIDSDQTSRTTAISDVKSALVVTDAVVDTVYSDTALIVTKTSDTHSRLVVVESAIDSDQTSRTTAISDVKSRLVVVESSIDSDQTSRTTAISDVKSALTIAASDVVLVEAVTTALGATAAANMALACGVAGIITGAATGTPTTTTMADTAQTEATDDHFIGRVIIWTSGVLLGQAAAITDYTGSTNLFTFAATTDACSATDTFIVV